MRRGTVGGTVGGISRRTGKKERRDVPVIGRSIVSLGGFGMGSFPAVWDRGSI
jgi:hypothetical protein